MKWIAAIKKNLQVLIRSKGSAMVVLLAPILIVIVIGIGFSDNTTPTLNIGIHSKDVTDLTTRYINNLNTTENNLLIFNTQQECVDSVKIGNAVACIVFPENFVVSNEKENEVFFYVDESRRNLVYRLISSLSLNLDVESSEVSKELTTRMLEILSRSSDEIDNSISSIISTKASSQSSKESATKSKSSLDNLDVNDVTINLSDIAGDIQTLGNDFKTVRTKAKSVIKEGYEVIDDLNNGSTTNDLETKIDSLNKTLSTATLSDDDIDTLLSSLEDTENGVQELQNKLSNTRSVKSSLLSNIDSLSSKLDSILSNLDSVKAKQESVKSDIDSFQIKNAASIVNPIKTTIEPVSSSTSRITFMFPYLLMLIVLFVGIMLSGTIVFMEKDSRAFFRIFTTPTRNTFFVWTTYLTSVAIIFIQTIVIMLLAKFALSVPAFTQLHISLIMIFLAMTVFIFLGMFIGHLFNTSEGIIMSTIAISSVLIFLSNLVLPIETLSPFIQQFVHLNPYVVASEGVRKAMLFNASFETLWVDMLIMFGYIVVILGAMAGAIKISSSKILQKMHINAHKKLISVPEDHYLKIDKFGLTIKSLHELLIALKSIKDQDYLSLIKPKNVFADWVSHNYKAKKLAFHMRTKKRTKAIELLEKYLEKKH